MWGFCLRTLCFLTLNTDFKADFKVDFLCKIKNIISTKGLFPVNFTEVFFFFSF